MYKIPVYKGEAELGLTEIIQASKSIAYVMPVNNAAKIKTYFKRQSYGKDVTVPERAIATNLDQLDLYYFASILVSSTWNLNDDVFGIEELWAARNTPEDKPINIEHRHEEIVGHITSCIAVDAETLDLVPDDTAVADLPKSLHLVSGGVLYKAWKTEELQERIDALIEKIEDKQEYVSMECLFKTFDYAIKRTDGSTGIVKRNDDTSFLTKHLRVYGGTGEYNGMRIGRYPRDLIFSGKGLTENPANADKNGPISIIFDAEKFEEMFIESTTAGVIDMSKELEAQVEELNKKLEAAVNEASEKATKLLDIEKALADANKVLEDTKAALEKKVAEAEAKYSELNQKYIDATRLSQLITAGHTKEAAEALVKKFSGLNDEMFAAVVELAKPTEAKAEEKDDKEDDDEEEADASLNDVEPTKDIASAGASDSQSDLAKEIANYLDFNKNKKEE